MIGQTLGHYHIFDKIGEGGMGVVYRAHDEQLNRDVAIKILRPGSLGDDSARKRFRKEAFALARLNHPNIETVYEFDTQGGVDFLVLECLTGTTLIDRIRRSPSTEKEIAHLGTQIAEDELRLEDGTYAQVKREAVLRFLALRETWQQGMIPTHEMIRNELERFHREAGTETQETFECWLQQNHLNHEEFRAFIEDQARLEWAQKRYSDSANA